MSFEGQARSWLSWARTPDHDAYWQYRDAFFDKLLPAPGRLTLEVGCGEGRVARDLARRRPRGVAPHPPPLPAAPPPPRPLGGGVFAPGVPPHPPEGRGRQPARGRGGGAGAGARPAA